MIYTGLPITFELAFYALMIAVALGIFSGVLAALKRNTFLDYFPMAIAMLGICVPTFLMGPILVLVFGINLEVLPVSGWDTLSGDKLLPSITLGFAYAAYIARLSRGGMLEVLGQDFIRTARAKGLSEFSIVTGGMLCREDYCQLFHSWVLQLQDYLRLICCRNNISNTWIRKILC